MRFIPISEFEQEEDKPFRFIPLQEMEAGGGRGFINPPMAYERQPERVIAPSPAPAPADYTDAMGNLLGGSSLPIDSRPTAATAAPAKPPKPPPYKSRLEALDDAVNLVEEGADFKRVAQAFSQIGIGEGDIMAHGKARKSPMFDLPDLSRRQIENYAKPQQQPVPQSTGEMRPIETSFAEDAVNLAKRVGARTRQSATNTLFQVGAINQDETARLFAQDQRKIEAAAPPESVQEGLRQFGEAKTFTDAAVALATNPKATFVALTESLLQTVPAMAVSMARVPALLRATSVGVSSGSLEFGSAMADVLGDRGVDLTNAAAISSALNKKEVVDEIREKGTKRGLTIGVIDALTAGFAGKFLRPVQDAIYAGKMSEQAAKRATLGAWGKELGMQVAGGSGGEALGQQLTGEFKPTDILLEGLAEGFTAPLEARGNLREARALSPNAQIASEIQAGVNAWDTAAQTATPSLVLDAMRTEAGTSNLISPAATVKNFTPPNSPTKQAGLVDIVVPLPNATPMLPEINQSTEEQFGLDKLRMGGANVGTTGLPGGLAGAGGEAGGGLIDGSMGAAGPGAAGATGVGGGIAPIPGVNDRQAVPLGGAAGQQLTGIAVGGEPLTWTGRAKTGYANEQDAQQAMATASAVIDTRQTHDWRVEPMGNGRFQIVGYQKETNLGTQTPQAQQGQAPGATAAGQTTGFAQGGAGGIPAATGTPLELSDTERAGLKLAPTAPIRELNTLNQQLDQQLGVTFSPVKMTDLNDSQRLASAVARLMGKTLTVVHQETGAGALPNGMINRVGGKHLFIADDADDAPLVLAVHEGIHGLPDAQRKSLNAALLDLFRQDRKGEFLNEFSYTPDRFEEEAPAMMAQAISKRADFWEQLRDKMGNKEFGEVAKVILAKLGDILTGAKKQYGEDFVSKYISDVAKARDLLTTAYADAMKAQGLKPDVKIAGEAMASNRTTTPETDAQASRFGFDQPGPEAGEYAIAVSGLGDVIGRVVSSPGEPLRMEISPEYMGRRFGSKVAEGDAAIKAAIEWASDGIQQGRKKLTAMAMAEERGLPTPSAGPALLPMASNRADQKNPAASRIGDVSADRFKRTPALQVALQDLQEGRITRDEYNKVVDETRPVYPYKEVPAITTEEEARTALSTGKSQSPEKAAKYGLPSKELKAGELVQGRLDIPSYQNSDAWVVTIHRPKTDNRSVQAAYDAGPTVGYESVAAFTDATFGMRQSSALKIAQASSKGTIATILGKWKPITPAEAKVKAQAAMKSPDWTQVGMDPFRHSYFYDRDSMRPVVAADEVIQVGPLVLAKNAKFDDNVDVTGAPLMFSNRGSGFANEKDQSKIVNAIDLAAAPEQKVAQLVQMTEENKPIVKDLLKRIDAAFGTKSKDNVKKPENILSKASRPSILSKKPWFGVEHIRDSYRFKTDLNSITQLPGIIKMLEESGVEIIKRDTDKLLTPGEWGWRIVAFDLRMPNGQLVEYYLPVSELEQAKKEKGHHLFELWRNHDITKLTQEDFVAYQGTLRESQELYQSAWDSYLARTGDTEADIRAALAKAAASSAEASLNPADSRAPMEIDGEGTDQAPSAARIAEKPSSITKAAREPSPSIQAAGKEEGTFIGSPDESSVSQSLYASNKAKTAGSYTYTTDDKGRITVAGDTARIRFLTKKVANGIVNDQGVRFNAQDVAKVLKALKAEPKTDASISSDIAGKLSLTPQELASTSLEYQTGLPKDRAFVAPLQGGIPEAVRFLEDRRRASGLRLLDISNLQDQDTLAKLIAAETLAAIRSSGNALEWYDETIAKTLAMAAVKYPELASDVNAQMVFRLAMAITSQGLNVENNLKFTMRQYDAFRRTGSYPEIGEGDSSQAMIGNFKLANALMTEMGQDTFRRFLVTPFTIGELNSAGFDPGGERVDEMVLGSSVFGPKIGFGFYSNLNGNFEPVTMDMWFMRTIGRLTGSLRTFDAERFGSQLERFRKSFDERGSDGVFADRFDAALIERARTDQDAAIELARQVKKAHERDFKENRAAFDAKTRKKSSLVLAADTMIQSIDKPRDVPASGTERRQLREVVRKAVAEVERVYGQRIPPAAMQALIWYPEQELYKALGVKLSVTSQDYAGATEKVLKEEGYDDKRLRAAAESGARRARQKDGGNVAGGNQAAGTKARQTGPIQGTEREQFLRDRYERAELAKEQVAPRRKGVVFEVAPDPNNESLTAAWRSLDAGQRREISERVAREIVPRVLSQFETDGIIAAQVGSYLDDTNPSFTLLLDKGDVVEVAKTLGFVLAQDSMMVISPKEFKGGDKVSALSIEVGNKSQAEIDDIYQKLREIRVGEDQPIAGQSYSNGVMTILNYSSVPSAELAILVDQKLNKAYSILTRDVFAAFPGKQEYDYASAANDGRGSRADLRRRARDFRSEATAALERELSDTGVQFSNRGGSDATGGGRDRGVGPQDVQAVTPSYGTPRENAASAVGYHYSTQPRTTLDSVMYGTGLRGAEMTRLQGADPRLKQRINFYIDRGTGINPEAGVGGQAHRVNLQNLYDVDEDTLRLRRDNESFNDFESAVIDAGFDGYMVRDAGPSGNAVLLGRHAVPVEQLGARSRMAGEPVAPARERVLSDAEKISANKMLPAGQVSGKRWAELISRGMPDVYERLAGNPVWQSDKVMYRGELARELRAEAPAFSNRASTDADSGRVTRYTPQIRRLPQVSPAKELTEEIVRGTRNLERSVQEVVEGDNTPAKRVIGRLPHVMGMLGARTQDFDIAASIVKKVFNGKHRDEFPEVSPREFVEAMYKPAMIFKDKDGNPREFEMVLSITNKAGALLMPIKVSVDNKDPLGAVLSLYNKRISNDPKSKNEMTIMRRIQQGNLLYVDPMLAKQAMTGRPRGGEKDGVKLNENFLSWPAVWPTIEKLIQERKVKTDIDLMEWIGKYYDPASSPLGMADAPAFSQRARAEDKEVAGLFRELQEARGLGRVRALERVDAHPMAETIRRIDQEFMDILERLDDAGLVKINCQ